MTVSYYHCCFESALVVALVQNDGIGYTRQASAMARRMRWNSNIDYHDELNLKTCWIINYLLNLYDKKSGWAVAINV